MEAECKEKANSQSAISLVEFENKFGNLKVDLDKLKIDIDLWNDVKVKSDEQICGLKRIIRDRQNDLMLNKSYKFVGIDVSKMKIEIEKVRFCLIFIRNLVKS